jgi:hypothetical protein
MGYTHYYYVENHYERETFRSIVKDFKKVMPVLEHLGVKLAGPFGDMEPIVNEECIAFNGMEKCGHTERDLGITWPSKTANGVSKLDMQHRQGNESMSDVNGKWFAGLELETRTCDGDCSHETFRLDRDSNRDEGSKTKNETSWKGFDGKMYRTNPLKIGKFFECTKTAYKPYDLAVTICLVIAKHYLENKIAISSDGEIKDWNDAMSICQHFLGYGENFSLDNAEDISEEPKEVRKQDFTEIERKAKEREILKSQPVKVGDIFERSWGYDQTNVDFYKVVELTKTGKSAKVIKIGQKITKQTGDMSELVEPDPEKVIGQKVHVWRIKQYRSDGSIYIGGLWRWDGTPCHQSHYA